MIAPVAAAAVLVLAACGGSDGDSLDLPHRGETGPYVGGGVGASP
jgi:hypothetical protein